MELSFKSSVFFNITIDFIGDSSDLNVSNFKDLELVDDFKDIFEVTRFNIISVILSILYVTLTNAFWISLMYSLIEITVSSLHELIEPDRSSTNRIFS